MRRRAAMARVTRRLRSNATTVAEFMRDMIGCLSCGAYGQAVQDLPPGIASVSNIRTRRCAARKTSVKILL
jgi:hypothetical protein